MNTTTSEERQRIDQRARQLYKEHAGDRSIVNQLMSQFGISRERALAAYGRAKLYWNHPDRRCQIG